jgi:hypothetical protein
MSEKQNHNVFRNDPEKRPSQKPEVFYVPAPYYQPGGSGQVISIHDLLLATWQGKWFIIGFILLSTLGAFLITRYAITPVYQSKAVISPTSSSGPVISAYLNSSNMIRNLVDKYDLLPILYANRWDDQNKQWRVRSDEIPTTDLVLAEGKLPFHFDSSYTMIWEGRNPAFNALMLERVIGELQLYLQNDFVSEAQIQMAVFEKEMAPLAEQFEGVWEQFWGLDKLTIAKLDLLGEYTRLKNIISDFKSKDALSRWFVVISEPIASTNPVYPKTNLITLVAFTSSVIVAIFAVFMSCLLSKRKWDEASCDRVR